MALLVIATGTAFAAEGVELDNIPAMGLPTLVVLGTPSCPPVSA